MKKLVHVMRKKMQTTVEKPPSSQAVTLDEVFERLAKDFRLSKRRVKNAVELYGGIYVIRRNLRGLSYRDKVASAIFTESEVPKLAYFVSTTYLDGQLRLLKETGTKIGQELIYQLASVNLDTRVSDETKHLLEKADFNTDVTLVNIMGKLELPDFKEVYQFIGKHILYH